MGLAASQGRMLLLTARKSDLEFRAQQISQRRLDLSRQLEEIASDYERATTNRQMKMSLQNGDQQVNRNLTYRNLISGSVRHGALKGVDNQAENIKNGTEAVCNMRYRLMDSDGAIVVSSMKEIPGYKKVEGKGEAIYAEDGEETLVNNSPDQTVQDNKKSLEKSKKKLVGNDGLINTEGLPTNVYIGSDGKRYRVDSNFTDEGQSPNYLQDCLRNGVYLLQKGSVTDDEEGDDLADGFKDGLKWQGIAWDATTDILDSYYNDDDDAAKAKYDRLQAQIQTQDKKLELELDDVETQRSAVKTEIESVKKIIDENIESTFNYTG